VSSGSRFNPLHLTNTVGDEGVIYFGKIMVFGSQPEDWDSVYSPCYKLVGKAKDRDGFVQCVTGSQEKPDLLPADNSTCSFPQLFQILKRFRTGIPGAVLAHQYIRYPVAAISRNAYLPSLRCEFVQRQCGGRIKTANFRSAGEKVEKEPRRPGYITERKTFRLQSDLSGTDSSYSGVWIYAECRRMQKSSCFYPAAMASSVACR
jgi:hypothetical protein